MGCNCNKNKNRYHVTLADGKVVYSTTNEATAEAVAKRYPGATVKNLSPA